MAKSELSFDLPGGAHALFTTRAHGNLSSVGGDGAEHGLESRELLRVQLGVRRLLRGFQVHGSTVQRVHDDRAEDENTPDSESQPQIEADGQATALKNLGTLVLTADCLPVALGSGGAVAIVHAGWRGLAAGVLEEGVRAVRELGDQGEIVAIIGPGRRSLLLRGRGRGARGVRRVRSRCETVRPKHRLEGNRPGAAAGGRGRRRAERRDLHNL